MCNKLLMVFLFIFIGFGCEVDTSVLSESQKAEKVKELAREELDSTRANWRAACDDNFDSLVRIKVDSIITAYMKNNSDSLFLLEQGN